MFITVGVNIDTRKLYHVLEITPASQNILLVGRHGIGKSEILTDYYNKKGIKVETLFLGQMSDPGDLIGLPFKEDFDGETSTSSRTNFIPPYWFPKDNNPIVLFLDELNRARPEILQTVMDLALNRKLAGKELPKGSRIIAAVNEGDEYQLTMLDPAFVSRFNVYYFCPTVQEWLLWAEKRNIDKRIISFISNEGIWLDGAEGQKNGIDTGFDKYPDRRAWERVSDCIQNIKELNEDDLDVISGIIGSQAASRFYGSVTGRRVLSGAEVLGDFASHKETLSKYLLHQLAMVNESIYRHLEIEGVGGAVKDDDLMNEVNQRYAKNLEAYYQFLEEREEKEAIAHFASVFETGNYQKAILFITNHTPSLFMKMAEFIASI